MFSLSRSHGPHHLLLYYKSYFVSQDTHSWASRGSWFSSAWAPPWMCLLTIIFLSTQFDSCTSISFHPSLKFIANIFATHWLWYPFSSCLYVSALSCLTNWLHELSQSQRALLLSSSRAGCKGLPWKDTVSFLAWCPRCLWTCQLWYPGIISAFHFSSRWWVIKFKLSHSSYNNSQRQTLRTMIAKLFPISVFWASLID